jgi:hypothetical protein
LEVKLPMPNTRIVPRGQPRSRGGARPGSGRKPVVDDDFMRNIGSAYLELIKREGYAQAKKEIQRRRARGERDFGVERLLSARRQPMLKLLQEKLRSGELEREFNFSCTDAQRDASRATLRRMTVRYHVWLRKLRRELERPRISSGI